MGKQGLYSNKEDSMRNKRTYIIGSMVIIILLVGLFSCRTYKSTDEQEVENTITEFFSAFYTGK